MTTSCSRCDSEDVEDVEQGHSIHLYRHEDFFQQCQECGHIEAYRGVADDPEAGFSFYLPDERVGASRPRCPDHDEPMQPTKLWTTEHVAQFKCTAPGDDGQPCQVVETRPLRPIEEMEVNGGQ